MALSDAVVLVNDNDFKTKVKFGLIKECQAQYATADTALKVLIRDIFLNLDDYTRLFIFLVAADNTVQQSAPNVNMGEVRTAIAAAMPILVGI